jgi:hypothetical protein
MAARWLPSPEIARRNMMRLLLLVVCVLVLSSLGCKKEATPVGYKKPVGRLRKPLDPDGSRAPAPKPNQ